LLNQCYFEGLQNLDVEVGFVGCMWVPQEIKGLKTFGFNI